MAAAQERLFPGIGSKSGEMLRAAGITSLPQLREIGSVRASVRFLPACGLRRQSLAQPALG